MVIGKLKLSCPRGKAKTLTYLTPKFIFFPIYPLSNLPREGERSLWLKDECLTKVKDLGVGARNRWRAKNIPWR